MPRKFAEMSSKFRFGQEFVEKLGISSTGVCITFTQYCRQVIYRGESPVYITCLLICYSDLHSCNTRYANYNLVCPKFKHKLDGSKTFTVTTCQLWNCFPITLWQDIRKTFRKGLKAVFSKKLTVWIIL